MPSLRSIISTLGLAIAMLDTSNASPVSTYGRPKPVHSRSPSIPADGALPQPASNMTLLYVALGRGVQNYTCATNDSTSSPVSIGALATLFDATPLAYSSQSSVDSLPACAVYSPLPASGPLTVSDYGSFPVLGEHFFNVSGTPTFDLYTVGDIFWGAKTSDVQAPSGSDAGPEDTGAVDWLQLQDKGGSVGVQEVYRVETAGGAAMATCEGQPSLVSVQYAADYYFYAML